MHDRCCAKEDELSSRQPWRVGSHAEQPTAAGVQQPWWWSSFITATRHREVQQPSRMGQGSASMSFAADKQPMTDGFSFKLRGTRATQVEGTCRCRTATTASTAQQLSTNPKF